MPSLISAQQQILHRTPDFLTIGIDVHLTFSIIGLSPESIDEASVFYSVDGELTFRRQVATFDGTFFVASIDGANITGSNLYYYILVETPTGQRVTFPSLRAESDPLRISIREQQTEAEPEPVSTPIAGLVQKVNYRILSPEPQTRMAADDALIAVSFFYEEGVADAESFRLFVNGEDVTEDAGVSPYIITYIPDWLPYGLNAAELIYLLEGDFISIVRWEFVVLDPASRAARLARDESTFTGDAQLTARNQVNAGNNYDFVRGSVNVRGRQGNFQYSVNGLLTSQESDRLQPQNRYGIHLSFGDFVHLEAGHVYPSINPLLMAGRRMFGINAEAKMLWQNFNIQLIHGQFNRKVESLYDNIERIITTETTAGGSTFEDTTYVMGLLPGGVGTFRQNVTGGRLSLGNERFIQVGINALSIRDDVNSIEYYNEYDPARMQQYSRNLDSGDRAFLAENPGQLNLSGGSQPPVDNFVAASDFMLRLDRNRIIVSADVAVSLLNNDISEGIITQDRADDLGFELGQDIVDILDLLSTIIIINERMNSLPIRIRDDEVEIFIPDGIFAYQGRANLNYFNNSFGFQYRWIGPDFVSLANNGLRRDIEGYTITNRFRMLRNTIYVNLLHENLRDNLGSQLSSTTNTMTYGANVSWFPVERNLPRITISTRFTQRDNNLDWENPFVPVNGRSNAVRNVREDEIDGQPVFLSLGTPRLQNTHQINGNISRIFNTNIASFDANMNVGYSYTHDRKFLYGDFESTSFSAGINTQFFNIPVRSTMNFNYNVSEAQSGLANIELIGGNLGVYLNLINNTLTINAETAIAQNKITSRFLDIDDGGDPENFYNDIFVPGDDVSEQETTSYIVSGGVIYRPYRAHQISLTGSYTNVVSRLLIGLIPNDHFLQLRYTYYF